jgi:hypothetical protein
MANAVGAVEAARRPIAVATVSGAFTPGGTVTLSGLQSLAVAGRSVVAHQWSLQCGQGTFTAADPAVALVEVPANESFTLRLAVTDDAGRTDRADVIVTPTGATTTPGTASPDGCAPLEVSVSPTTTSVLPNSSRTFTATVTNAADQTVTWQVDGVAGGNTVRGTITATGVYTAPASVPTPAVVTVTAVSNQDPSRSASASVTIQTVQLPQQTTTSSGGGGAVDLAGLLALLFALFRRPLVRRRVT